MSLDKAIQFGKEYRKSYKGAKAIDRSCRNHRSCAYCRDNRLYQYLKEESKKAKQTLKKTCLT